MWKNLAKILSLFFAFSPVPEICLLRNREVALMDIQKELIAEYDRETATTRTILEADSRRRRLCLEAAFQINGPRASGRPHFGH